MEDDWASPILRNLHPKKIHGKPQLSDFENFTSGALGESSQPGRGFGGFGGLAE